jgi:Trk K+ transport system NAD-binding subunit
MEEILYGVTLRPVFAAGNGEVEIYELSVAQEWDERQLSEMLPAETCTVVSVTHAGHASVPNLTTRLQAGDLVLLSATLEGIKCLRDHLNKSKEG